MKKLRILTGDGRKTILTALFGLLVAALLASGAIQQGLFYLGLERIGEGWSQREADYQLQREKEHLRNLINAPMNVLASYAREANSTRKIEEQIDAVLGMVKSKARTPEEARRLLIETASTVRFGRYGRDYLWINDAHIMLMHPRAIFSGRSINDDVFTETGGKGSFVRNLVDICAAPRGQAGPPAGEARLEYTWPKPEGGVENHLAYLRYLPDLNLYIGGEFHPDDDIALIRDKAMEEIAMLRLADGNYFWVNDMNGILLSHPDRRDLIGTDLRNIRDSKGQAYFAELIDKCRADGEAYLTYYWTKPGAEGSDHPKLSYVRLFKPWNVMVGMGVYVDDIQAQAQARKGELLSEVRGVMARTSAFNLLIVAVIGGLAVLALKALLARPLGRLTAYASDVAAGDLERGRESGSFPGELGILKTTVENLVDSVKAKIGEVEKQRLETERQAERVKEALRESATARKAAGDLNRYQSQEFASMFASLKALADGDLTAAYLPEIPDDETCAEAAKGFAGIGLALDTVTSNLSSMLQSIGRNSATLSESGEKLAAFAAQLMGATSEMNAQAASVAGVTTQMSGNITSIAASVEELSGGVTAISSTAEEISRTMTSVAGAVERFSQSIGEISDTAYKGSRVTSEATRMSERAGEVMTALGEAAREIGVVTEVIKRIADQTNLLALNATIEAASAGEAGRGFAVVAGEVKALAGKSATAAADISERIRGIQTKTGEAMGIVEEIVAVIKEVDASTSTISNAVERQTEAVDEIAGSLSQTESGAAEIAKAISESARSAEEVARHVSDSAVGVREVAANIKNVSQTLAGNSQAAQEVRDMAGALAGMASALRESARRFKVK